MSNQLPPRTCGVCRNLKPHETELARLRVTKEDLAEFPDLKLREPGLVHSCPDCTNRLVPVMVPRILDALFARTAKKLLLDLLSKWLSEHAGAIPDMAALMKEADDLAKQKMGALTPARLGPNDFM